MQAIVTDEQSIECMSLHNTKDTILEALQLPGLVTLRPIHASHLMLQARLR